jgi:dTDP-4-dehydrorhamnose 3,5-epimerase-like enzyme
VSLIRLIDLAIMGDSRGGLVAIEQFKDAPFEIKRVYYIFNTLEGVSRGFHAHRDLKQLLICVAGSCEVILDDGKNRQKILLENPKKGLFVDRMIWREMHNFSKDCVLLVLANEFYDEGDYIRNYDEFLKLSLT